jgi:hypothetical protein
MARRKASSALCAGKDISTVRSLGRLWSDSCSTSWTSSTGNGAIRIDGEVPNGQASCLPPCRAGDLFGSAPTAAAAHRGIKNRRVKVGCVMLGESPAVFGDASRRLSAATTYLYQEGARYWYATQATVTKLAEDSAEQLKREPDEVAQELEQQLREDLRKTANSVVFTFSRTRAATCATTMTRGWWSWDPIMLQQGQRQRCRRQQSNPLNPQKHSPSRSAVRCVLPLWYSCAPASCVRQPGRTLILRRQNGVTP